MYEDKFFLDNLETQFTIHKNLYLGSFVNFQNTGNTPFQRWYPYREGYSYNIVEYFIHKFGVKGNVLDPFVGSGSTILASRKKGLKATGIDVNPLSVFISKTENDIYTNKDIEVIKSKLIDLKNLKEDDIERKTNFYLAKKYFNEDILKSLLNIYSFINNLFYEKAKHLFLLDWLSILEPVSYMKKEGNGLKYKTRKRKGNRYTEIPREDWDKRNYPENKFEFIKEQISKKLELYISDIKHYQLKGPEPNIILGDSIKYLSNINEEIQLTIFSPPYVNFFDYFEIHKIELWMGGFVKNREQFKKLKSAGLRSNGNVPNNTIIHNENKSVEHLTNLISQKKLWSKKIPTVVAAYFDDMEFLLRNLFKITVANGTVCIIVGNSAYGGILVPSDLLIAEIGRKIGFKVEEIIITRYLTTSSQQKNKLINADNFLRESIVVLRK